MDRIPHALWDLYSCSICGGGVYEERDEVIAGAAPAFVLSPIAKALGGGEEETRVFVYLFFRSPVRISLLRRQASVTRKTTSFQ